MNHDGLLMLTAAARNCVLAKADSIAAKAAGIAAVAAEIVAVYLRISLAVGGLTSHCQPLSGTCQTHGYPS